VNLPSASASSGRDTVRFFVARHLGAFLGLSGLGVIVGFLEGLNLAVFIPVLNGLLGLDAQQSPLHRDGGLIGGMNRLLRELPVADPFLAAAAAFLALTLLKGFLALVHEYATANVTGRMLHGYRTELLRRYRESPLGFFAANRVGGLIYNLNQPPIMAARLLYILPRTVVDALRLAFVLALLLYLEPLITLGLAAASAAAYFGFSSRVAFYLHRYAQRRRAAEQQMSSIATEWMHGIRQIRIGGGDAHWIAGFDADSRTARSAYVRTSFLLASPRHFFETIGFVVLLLAIIAAYRADPGAFRDHVAMIGFFAMGLVRVLPSIATLARAPLEIRNVLPDASYLHHALRDGAVAVGGGTVPFQALRQAIHVEGVSVHFGERGPALRELSVEIPRGSVCGFVGPSGSGKTTLLNVLIGVQPPSAGRVLYDATDLAVLDHASLLRGVGYLGQEVLLFHGSIRDNISFFRDEVPLERVRRAARLAGINEFIETLPQRYDAYVGERGVNLSGGQAQRIALARALINDPAILVLDEPTSALDGSSEQVVLQALKSAAQGRTVIMVTHRLRAVNWADTIHVLDAGRLVESGSWADLAARPDGRFRAMCLEQRLV